MPGVYLSYPFCQQKCTFCNFASDVGSQDAAARYSRALSGELHRHAWAWLPETIYLGGGTPSLMPPALLRDLLGSIPRERISEVTMECAPGTMEPEALEVWRECGVNRVSLGVQSFVREELRRTGRRHTAEIVQSDLALLRNAGISNISIDLIAGLPGQSVASWTHSLDWVERLRLPHVSIYIFEVDEDSRLGNEILLGGSRYGAHAVPNDDLSAELYERAVERLRQMQLPRYEISNFARGGWESRHNLKYWQREPYMGFGLDAHSFDGTYRWSNPDNLLDYFAAQDKCGLQPSIERVSTDAAEEHFFVGLRLAAGIAPSAEEWSRFAAPIEKWVHAGMLERFDGRLRLSDRGVLVSNEVFEEFINV